MPGPAVATARAKRPVGVWICAGDRDIEIHGRERADQPRREGQLFICVMIAETGKGRKLFKSFPRDARALNVAICFIAAVRAGTDQGNVESWTPGNAPCDFFKSNLGA